MLRHAILAITGLAFGWALDRFGWPARIRPHRPAWSETVMLVLGAAGFAAASARMRPLMTASLTGAFLALMVALGIIDALTRIIPNRLLYPAGVVFAVAIPTASTFTPGLHPIGGLVGVLTYGGVLLAVNLVSPSGLGMGDVKLAMLIGFVLGSLRLAAVWFAALAGVLAGGLGALVALAVFRSGRRGTIPYGPFLAGGAMLGALMIPRIA